MDRLGISLLPLGTVAGDDLANGHGVGHHITDQTLETVDDLLDPRVRLASVLPPGADAVSLLLQVLIDLEFQFWINFVVG